MTKSGLAGCALGALMLSALPAAAQTTRPEEGWRFALSPYVWFTGVSGDATVRSQTDSIQADFGDLFDNLKFAFSGFAEARNGRFSIVTDIMYYNLSQGIPLPGLGEYSGGSTRLQTTEVAAIGLFTLAEAPAYRLEMGGGVRLWWMTNEINLDAGKLPARSVRSTSNWADPIISARGTFRLSDTWSATLYGDVGGFGLGSELTWQALATIDWRVTQNISASIGYRWIYIDYAKGEAEVSMNMTGPIIGATLRF
jgi:opacity protein-like surface antigen